MTLQRVDRLKEPPVVGEFYLVPAVHGKWYDRVGVWPVIGPQHNDPDFFNFDQQHYHIDGRFLTVRQRDYAGWRNGLAHAIQSAPLMMDAKGIRPLRMPKAKLIRRRCIFSEIPYVPTREPIPTIRAHFAGQHCAGSKENWICPHRNAPLGSIAAIDGVITCPLHGLRIDAATGKCLPVSA